VVGMTGARRRQVRRTVDQRRAVVRRFETSGMGAVEFCRREGLALSSLQRWRARLGGAQVARFVELTPAPATPPAPTAGWAVELELPGGLHLRLRG
jgi:hypothetical protein